MIVSTDIVRAIIYQGDTTIFPSFNVGSSTLRGRIKVSDSRAIDLRISPVSGGFSLRIAYDDSISIEPGEYIFDIYDTVKMETVLAGRILVKEAVAAK